jgi:hypothetical protein
MDEARWEHGSDFFLTLDSGTLEAPWLERPHGLWGSGRDALRALLAWGREQQGWKRLRAPTYFCQDVLRTLARELPIALYEDAPDRHLPLCVQANRSDVLLVVNFYGMRNSLRVDTGAVVVEDHTHDPLSDCAFASKADYAFASLRKTLPLPDGGVLWSPTWKNLPREQPATGDHLRVTLDRLSAMVLKCHYLEGAFVDKSEIRARFLEGEQAIGGGSISGISPFSRERVRSLPVRRWREARADNLETLRREIRTISTFELLDSPFAGTLLFDSADVRENVRAALITERIYPAVLWPLDGCEAAIPAEQIDLSRRLLTLHCDFRYSRDDMARVAGRIRALSVAASQKSAYRSEAAGESSGRGQSRPLH